MLNDRTFSPINADMNDSHHRPSKPTAEQYKSPFPYAEAAEICRAWLPHMPEPLRSEVGELVEAMQLGAKMATDHRSDVVQITNNHMFFGEAMEHLPHQMEGGVSDLLELIGEQLCAAYEVLSCGESLADKAFLKMPYPQPPTASPT